MKVFEKYKKIIFIFLPLFILLSGGLLVKYQLPKIVEVILKVVVGPTISTQEIKFPKFGEIDIKNLTLSKDKKVIIASPSVKILYSKESLKKLRLQEIIVNDPWVNIHRKGEDVNIVDAFSSGDSSDSKDDSKAGAAVPIDKIIVNNGKLLYEDTTYSREIKRELDNVEGYVAFNKKTGIDLKFTGNKDKEKYIYKFNNSKEKLDMDIILENIKVTSELVQYGYDDPDISQVTGIFNMNLKIATSGLFGNATLSNGDVKYLGLSENVKDINGDIKFKGDSIDVDFDYFLGTNPGQFKVRYSEKDGVNVDLTLKDLPFKVAEKYKLLGDLNLPLENVDFDNINVNLFYKSDLGFKATVKYDAKPFKLYGIKFNNLNGKLIYKDGILNLDGNDISLFVESLGLEKKLNYQVSLDLEKKDLLFNVKSNYVSLNGIYEKENKKIKLYQNSKMALEYDLKKNNLDQINLKIENILEDYKLNIKGKEKNKEISIKKLTLKNSKNEELLFIKGNINRENLKYNFYINTNKLTEKELFKELKLKINLSLKGQISGEKDKFLFQGDVTDFTAANDEMGISTYATVEVIKDKELQMDLNGEIRKMNYKDYSICGIKVESRFKDNILTLVDVRNRFLDLKGEINLNNKNLDLNYSINSYISDNIKNSSIKLGLKNIQGSVLGNIENPEVISNIKEAYIQLPNEEKVFLKGKIQLENKILILNGFQINQSLLFLNYNLISNKGDFKVNILEENLSQYYNFKKLKYRILSRVEGEIDKGNIKSNILLNIDRVYFNGSELPNIKGELNYEKNSQKNSLEILSLKMLGLQGKKLFNSFGTVDFRNNKINYKIPDQKIYVKDLQGIIETENLTGNIEIKNEVLGELKNPNYSFEIKNGKFGIKNFEFNKISLLLKGNLEKLDLKKAIIYYEGNQIKGTGNYNIKKSEYEFKILSKNIDLSFLNVISNQKYVENIQGKGNINILLSNNYSKNIGYINLENIKAEIPSALVSIKDVNLNIKINNEKIYLTNLSGIINKGKIKGTGYIKIPDMDEMEMDSEFYKNLDYNLKLSMKNVIYELKDYFSLDISTGLFFSDNKINGNVIVNNGVITGIVKEDKGLIVTIFNFIVDKTRALIGQSKKLGKDFEIKSKLENSPDFNIGVLIKKGIDINISDVSSLAQDVKGKILGRMEIIGRNDNIAVVGELEVQNGHFYLGDEEFLVTRAIILSDKRNGRITDFNPNLVVEVSSLDPTSRLDISLQGELNSLNLNIVTDQGRQSSNLKELFTSNGDGPENQKDAVALLFKTLIDSQISSTLLRPISKTIKDVLHISKFRIVSDIFNQEVLSNSDNNNGSAQETNMLGFGAYLEAENSIYKNKYFWVARIGIVDGSRYSVDASDKSKDQGAISDTINQFDFKVERRYKSGWSYGIGTAKLNDTTAIEENKKGNLNYYVDFKFERKYNSINDIFFKKN